MKITKSMLGGVILVFFAVAANAEVQNVNNLNRIIRQKGAHWQAKESWVSRLSHDQIHRMLGSNERPTGSLSYSHTQTAHLAGSLDWRNRNGVNWLGPVLNQGNCGSCVAYSTVGTLEAQWSISSGMPWLHPTFSPDQLFACGGGGCDMGWMPSSAANFLKRKGIVDLACAPSTMSSTGQDVSCGETTQNCSNVASRTYKISGVDRPTDGLFKRSADSLKAALAKGPVVTTMTVYTDFLMYSSGVYRHVSGSAEGGHAVSIVGYDDASRVWIVRNSWGPEWGEKGFVRVSYDDDSGVGVSTWQFEIPHHNEYLTIASPAENDYISGNYSMHVGDSTQDNLNIEIRQAGTSKALMNLSCAKEGASDCVSVLDTRTLADGHYEAVAKSGSAQSFSLARSFYVVNQEPKNLSIQFTGVDVDLTKPLEGRVEFNVYPHSDSVPFHGVAMVISQNGKVITTRTTEGVVPSMKVGFRTNTLPNGAYDIFFRGDLPANGKVLTVDSPVAHVTFQN